MINILIDLKAEAQKLIKSGDSHKKARGKGMMKVINAITSHEVNKEKAIEKAGYYLCGNDEFIIAEQVKSITEHKNSDDYIDNVKGVTVWKKMEYRFTCKEFLDLINDYGI